MSEIPEAVRMLERDLRGIFGSRLQSLAIYGQRAVRHTHGAHAAHEHVDTESLPRRAALLAGLLATTP